MKKAVLIGLILFWTIVVSLLSAGFISYENQRLFGNKNQQSTATGGSGAANPLTAASKVAQVDRVPGITLDAVEVAKHNSIESCWMIISDKVYDVTSYIPEHPGGISEILKYCGQDGTTAFQTKDMAARPKDHSSFAYSLLASYYVGDLGEVIGSSNGSTTGGSANAIISKPTTGQQNGTPQTNTTQPDTNSGISMADVAKHNNQNDCWLVIHGKVYDVTSFIFQHPGGASAILDYCGKDGTQAFEAVGHSGSARSMLPSYYVGDLATAANTTSGSTGTTGTTNTTSSTGFPVIDAQFPGATITSTKYEDDGRVEVQFIYNGRSYKVKLDSGGNVREFDD